MNRYKRIDQRDILFIEKIVGKERLSKGISNLRLHSADQSHHRASLPDLVVWPINEDEVSAILSYANENLIPVTAWGAGTSLEGNTIPICGGIVLDFSMMNKIIQIREEDFQADVQPGVIYQDLNHKLRHKGLFFPPDPGARASIGGMVGNNASGIRSIKYGSTKDNVLRLRVVLANGEIIEVGSRSYKSSSGYDLLRLFIGSEGTLGIFVEITVRLRGIPEEMSSCLSTFRDIESASKAVYEIMKSGLDPACLEIMDSRCIEVINKINGLGLDVSDTLIIEFHGSSKEEIRDKVIFCEDICKSFGCKRFIFGIERDQYKKIIDARHVLGDSMRKYHAGRVHTVSDVCVPISKFPDIVYFAKEKIMDTDIPAYIFGHAGEGNLHLAFMVDENSRKEWEKVERIKDELTDTALKLGGTSTGEHGVGIGKRKYMFKEHGFSLEWMKKIKELFDPNGILNPGKIFP